MHHLAFIKIENYRSCRSVELPLERFTPLVGQNNCGKSTILEAIKWLLKPSALSSQDFFDSTQLCRVTGLVVDITDGILSKIPDDKHRTVFKPFCPGGKLWIRVTVQPNKTKETKQEVWDPEQPIESNIPEHWRDYPTGIAQAVTAIFPEPLSIQAMKDVQKDFTSVAAGTSIKRLIEEMAGPVTAKHKAKIDESLTAINQLLTGDSEHRSEALKDFDEKASSVVAEFFPGLNLHLDLPETKLKEFFKSGTLRVKEAGRDSWTEFSQLGSGAQRSIEMGLIRYLSEEPEQEENPPCKLLLIDEPELYLHPQGVRRIRKALLQLLRKGFQVVFSTHSPLMLDRANTSQTIIVKKTVGGTSTRKPLKQAVELAIEDAPSQSRVLFQLGNLADIYFADTVVICEGKTDNRLLPLAYERHYGHAPDHDHIAFISLGSCSDIRKGMDVLKAMEIKARAVADLDFGFVECIKGNDALVDKGGPEISKFKEVLLALQSAHNFKLNGGFPTGGNDWKAAEICALFANHEEGKPICEKLHADLLPHGCWIWKQGCIEHVMDIDTKGEGAIEAQEEMLRGMPQADIAAKFPTLVDCFEWIREGV